MLTIGSLCAGACDGLSLGLEWAGLGPTVWQVEIEPDRRANLARHWPEADRSVADVRLANFSNLAPVDIIVASAPCQDLSSAGKRVGLDGPRSGLWWECQRIITGLVPRWVVVENVASGARNWVPHVRQGLERLGYTTLPVPIAASDCGAPHLRRRVFVLANADGKLKSAGSVNAEVASAQANALADTEGIGLRSRETRSKEPGGRSLSLGGGALCDSLREPSVRLYEQGTERSEATERLARRQHSGWPTELEVVPPVHGVVVSAIGDSVVPQCAEVVGWIIRELEGI